MQSSLTIGNFDGVHLGHQELIKRVLTFSQKNNCLPRVVTFEPHPREFLGIRPIPSRICSLNEKKRRIQHFGISQVEVLNFDEKFSNQSPLDFLNWIKQSYNPLHIVVGKNFFFGKNRGGNTELLSSWGKKEKILIEVIDALKIDSITVSSSEVRHQIQEGKILKANSLLGIPLHFDLEVVSGDHRGRTMGVPTLNSPPPKNSNVASRFCLPPHGVYITRSFIEGRIYASLTNFGIRPTFHTSEEGEFFETHLLNYPSQELSCKRLSVEFLDRIRAELRFSSKEELLQRIQEDIRIARAFHSLK
jgi:riboflavin kinase/FMN adenylyltransferase